MSIPVNLLRYAGIWDAGTNYSQFQFVNSPINTLAYIYVGNQDIVGGGDPSIPNPLWVLFPNSAIAPFAPAYASFSSTATQNINPLFPVLAPLVLSYDTQDIVPQGISLILPAATQLQVAVSGVYKVIASVQLNRTIGGFSDINLYPAINGTPVPNSATKLSINQNIENIMTVEWFLQLNASEAVSIVLYSTDAGNQALAVAAAPPVPAIPSIITTITRIA